MQTALIQLGGNEWQKGNHHRIYFNYEQLVEFYGLKSNSFGHSVDGEKVSNSRAAALHRHFTEGKLWYDVTTGEFHSRDIKEEWAEKVIERITEAVNTLADTQAEEEAEEAAVEAPVKERQAATVGSTVRTATGPGIQSRPVRTNKYAGYCARCGQYVRPGEGVTYRIDPDEAYEHSGWVVEHREGDCQ